MNADSWGEPIVCGLFHNVRCNTFCSAILLMIKNMSPERWRQIEALYHSARERGRKVLVDADPELRESVERLLAQDSESGGKLLDQPAADLMPDVTEPQVTTGAQLGPYRIEAPLGRGGMGQVFTATDTRLGRLVAVKISHERFSNRFETEARAIAALNHPNICALYDVGPNYLVMELVEGEVLSDRLKRGKLSLEMTVRYGAQICDALAAAHAKGIVHRDLKPGNIMLTSAGVKVLDFGLAKTAQDLTVTATHEVIGTPAYMAPEQFDARPVDARTDVYALGRVLAEMATGKRPTSGQPGDLQTPLGRVIKRCLEDDPDERWQSARDLKWELQSLAGEPVSAFRRSRTALLAGAVGLLALLVALLVLSHFRQPTSPPQETRASVLLPDNSRPLSLAVSPDGRYIALVLVRQGKQQIWVRALADLELTPLAGTDGATNPFWSPDSRTIGFFADARLKKIDRAGGEVQTLCDALGALGGTWNQYGEILVGALNGIQRVPAAGGAMSDLPNHVRVDGIYPSFLPDGRHYLTTNAPRGEHPGVWLHSMDGPESRQIVPDSSNAQVVESLPGSQTGNLLFTRAGTLMALPFDMKHLKPAGEPFSLAQRIVTRGEYEWLASASMQGVLAYVSGERGGWQYVLRDRQGRRLAAYDGAGAVAMISPDGKRLTGDRASDIWVLEFKRGISTRLTFSPPSPFNPIWSQDGRYVAYAILGAGIFRKEADGSHAQELLLRTDRLAVPKSWSPDGRFILYAQINPGTGADLLALPVEPDPKPLVLAQTKATEDQGQFSPDGRWVAFTSNESGLSEIYVVPFPPSPGGGKWMVSRGGGVQPRWNRNGKELFYISPDSEMMSVPVETEPVFTAGSPHALFQSELVDTGIRTGPISWDVMPDGNRFVIISPNSSDTSSLTVALNWRAAGSGKQ